MTFFSFSWLFWTSSCASWGFRFELQTLCFFVINGLIKGENEKPSGQYLSLIYDESLTCRGLNSNSGCFGSFTFTFVSCGESCLLVSWCTGGRYNMVGSDEDHDRNTKRREPAGAEIRRTWICLQQHESRQHLRKKKNPERKTGQRQQPTHKSLCEKKARAGDQKKRHRGWGNPKVQLTNPSQGNLVPTPRFELSTQKSPRENKKWIAKSWRTVDFLRSSTNMKWKTYNANKMGSHKLSSFDYEQALIMY
jgi:hypothetical protein